MFCCRMSSSDRFKAIAHEFSIYLAQSEHQCPQNREDLKNLFQQWCKAMKKSSSGFSEILYNMRTSGVLEVKEEGLRWKEKKLVSLLQSFPTQATSSPAKKPAPVAVAVPSEAVPSKNINKQRPSIPGVQVIRDRAACEMAVATLLKETMLTLDCEGIDLGKSIENAGGLCLIQLGTKSSGVFLFDPVEMVGGFQGLLDAGLKRVLEGPIIKFIHDCRMDVAALFLASKEQELHVKNVMDTQIMFGLLNPDDTEVGLLRLLKGYGGNGSKDHPGKLFAMYDWRIRGLSKEAMEYAAADVKFLFPAAEEMVKLLDRQNKVKDARDRSTARVLQQLESIKLDLLSAPAEVVLAKVFNMDQKDGERFAYNARVVEEFEALLDVLPDEFCELILAFPNVSKNLIDLKVDEGRFFSFSLKNQPPFESDLVVTRDHLNHIKDLVGRPTGSNRATVSRSLHRCSFIVDPTTEGKHFATGATIRMARAVYGIADTIDEILHSGKSILLVGKPGCGKTTLLRDMARVLGNMRNVMIVDTNNEIAGEHTVPHAAIGKARRMKVGDRADQYRVMLEAVQNHTPDVLVIDEIGTHEEVQEAVSIKLRGVQLIATTHGTTLADVINNPQLKNLLGGVNVVTLSAGERAEEGALTKTRLEQKSQPAFDVCIEIHSLREWRIHYDINTAVRYVLRNMGEKLLSEVRTFDETTKSYSKTETPFP